MKTILCLLAAAALLCGCNKPADDKTRDDKLVALELRIQTLESRQQSDWQFASTNISRIYTTIGNLNTNDSLIIDKLEVVFTYLKNHPMPLAPLLDPATGLPVGANPADYSKGLIDTTTGLPIPNPKK
jgi:hypothetical protein